MGFSAKQLAVLRRDLDTRQVRTREARGRTLSYLEGWYVISEANRIFGFDGWSRETLDSRCALARESRGNYLAVYVARVRITVSAHGAVIIREGYGTGEGRGITPGETHDIAVKAAETDATKRALATFGKPFGLELYRTGKAAPASENQAPAQPPSAAEGRTGFHPDDTTPIPRPSRYYGRRQSVPVSEHLNHERRNVTSRSAAPPLVPVTPDLSPGRIDKSALVIGEPKRIRDKAHLKFVASKSCLVCGRQPSDPHHLRFAQPRAIGMKVSDEYTVPLCRGHHQQLHQTGDELSWWQERKINALEVARQLWEQTHPKSMTTDKEITDTNQNNNN